jgi:hypothetical protein
MLQRITTPSAIPRWNDDEDDFAAWANHVLDLEIGASNEATDADWARMSAEEEYELVFAFRRPTLIAALRTGQPLSDPQRVLIADWLEDEDKPKPKRKRGRPKGSGWRSNIHSAGRDVYRIKKRSCRDVFPNRRVFMRAPWRLPRTFGGSIKQLSRIS